MNLQALLTVCVKNMSHTVRPDFERVRHFTILTDNFRWITLLSVHRGTDKFLKFSVSCGLSVFHAIYRYGCPYFVKQMLSPRDLYYLPNIVRVVKSRRMRWAGHVSRMGEGRGVHRVLVGKPEGKRPLGRPRHRWEDNIKMDLREVGGGGDWMKP